MLQIVKANWLLIVVIENELKYLNLFEFSCSTAEVCYTVKLGYNEPLGTGRICSL